VVRKRKKIIVDVGEYQIHEKEKTPLQEKDIHTR
jgi:hypothetical protein